VVPTFNEEKNLPPLLENLRAEPGLEVIVVDGGSTDHTIELVEESGARLVKSPAGRGRQQNIGAAAASGDILLFLHADTSLPAGFADLIQDCLSAPKVAAGAFSLQIENQGVPIRLIEILANWRARQLQMPYGDQALFMKKKVFEDAGGFPEIEIMEDFALVRKLRRLGKIVILPQKAATSGRRWQKLGALRTTMINQVVIIGYLLGRSPTSLANWYRISSRARR